MFEDKFHVSLCTKIKFTTSMPHLHSKKFPPRSSAARRSNKRGFFGFWPCVAVFFRTRPHCISEIALHPRRAKKAASFLETQSTRWTTTHRGSQNKILVLDTLPTLSPQNMKTIWNFALSNPHTSQKAVRLMWGPISKRCPPYVGHKKNLVDSRLKKFATTGTHTIVKTALCEAHLLAL